ncbi:hypothetical protein A2U01_0066658, partial [Trifolium medium]|nr:hypothetical protein [Trifolium medium]
MFIPHHSLLPVLVPPEIYQSNKNNDSPTSLSVAETMPDFGTFIRQRSNDLSAAIAKRVSSFRQSMEENLNSNSNEVENNDRNHEVEVTEYNLSGLKVFVKVKPEEES